MTSGEFDAQGFHARNVDRYAASLAAALQAWHDRDRFDPASHYQLANRLRQDAENLTAEVVALVDLALVTVEAPRPVVLEARPQPDPRDWERGTA